MIYDKAKSNLMSIDCIAPHWRNFDPILFIMFINDLIKSAPLPQLVLFTNETRFFLSDPYPNLLVQRANAALTKGKTCLLNNCSTSNERKA